MRKRRVQFCNRVVINSSAFNGIDISYIDCGKSVESQKPAAQIQGVASPTETGFNGAVGTSFATAGMHHQAAS